MSSAPTGVLVESLSYERASMRPFLTRVACRVPLLPEDLSPSSPSRTRGPRRAPAKLRRSSWTRRGSGPLAREGLDRDPALERASSRTSVEASSPRWASTSSDEAPTLVEPLSTTPREPSGGPLLERDPTRTPLGEGAQRGPLPGPLRATEGLPCRTPSLNAGGPRLSRPLTERGPPQAPAPLSKGAPLVSTRTSGRGGRAGLSLIRPRARARTSFRLRMEQPREQTLWPPRATRCPAIG